MAKKKKAATASNVASSTAAPNLFETLWSRRKFDILGKKQKGEGKRIGHLRSRAIEKRNKTILQEYKLRHKSNAFIDRRFGENDENMGEDEKAIMRFQRERQAQLQKKNKFALPDVEDEEEDILTHKGAALAELDDFKDDVSVEDDDNDTRELDEETEKALNFGGGHTESGDKKEHRSKKEIMEEVIAKSKHFKALKAKQKDDDLELREKLDKDFKLLAGTPALLSLVRPQKKNPLKALLAKKSEGTDVDAVNEIVEKDQPDEYDKLMKEMVFDIRAHASDRLKTGEEIAKEEKERLEELEKRRKQRMMGTTESESENEESDMENDEKKRKRKRPAQISGDDLGENFVLEEDYREKGWVDEVMARTNDEDDDGDSEIDDDEDVHEDDEGDQDDEFDEDEELDDDHEEPTKGDEDLTSPPTKGNDVEEHKGVFSEEYAGELPYVIKAPQSLDDFRGLVKNRSDAELEDAIQRVRTCNAISLAAENRKKMQIFYNVLVLYFSELAGSKQLNLARINLLTRPLIEMSSDTPYFAATCARERLIRMQKQLSEKLRIKDGSSCWPSVRTLLLMRLWSLIFPASDFRHVVMTPLMLLMGEYLIRCPVTSSRDVAVGSFLCSLALSIMKHARRFCPEALNFLLGLLSTGLPDTSLSRKQCPQYLRELIGNKSWLLLKDSCSDIQPLSFIEIMTTEADSDILNSDTFRVGLLRTSVQTLMGFVGIYKDLPSFPEVFKQFLPVLLELSLSKNIPFQLKNSLTEAINVIKSTVEEQENFRQPLRMRLKKPTPIKQFNPKFEEDYAKGRDYDIDKDRAEKKKLLKQIKRESKGAARELKKDNQFLAAEKQKERMEVEQEREEKYRKAMAFLEEQESAAKSGQLGRKRRRR